MAAVYCLDRWKTFTDYFRFLHDISVQNAYITKEQDFFLLTVNFRHAVCVIISRLYVMEMGRGGGKEEQREMKS